MRKTFQQILESGKIDIRLEYNKLYELFYGKSVRNSNDEFVSVADLVNWNFHSIHFRGTCLSLEEFNKKYGFSFSKNPKNVDIELLVRFCEYLQNLIWGMKLSGGYGSAGYYSMFNYDFFLEQIRLVVEEIGYKWITDKMVYSLIEKNTAAKSVSESELIPDDMSFDVLFYNHYSLSGNTNEKKQILLKFASVLEHKDNELNEESPALKRDLFFAFNNLNIRHNNVDPNGDAYKPIVAAMSSTELESLYDEIYQMCLLAVMLIDNKERKEKFRLLRESFKA